MKTHNRAYFQYGFKIATAIANRILSDSIPAGLADLNIEGGGQKLRDYCIGSLKSYYSIAEHEHSFLDDKNALFSRQMDDIYKIFDLLQFEYLAGQCDSITFRLRTLYNFTNGFIAGLNRSVREITCFLYGIIHDGSVSDSRKEEDFIKMMMLSYPTFVDIVNRQREGAEKELRENPDLARVEKFIHEKDDFLRQYKIDEKTGFAKLDVSYECHVRQEDFYRKAVSSKISSIHNKISLFLRFFP